MGVWSWNRGPSYQFLKGAHLVYAQARSQPARYVENYAMDAPTATVVAAARGEMEGWTSITLDGVRKERFRGTDDRDASVEIIIEPIGKEVFIPALFRGGILLGLLEPIRLTLPPERRTLVTIIRSAGTFDQFRAWLFRVKAG